jgi:hypothetical protein
MNLRKGKDLSEDVSETSNSVVDLSLVVLTAKGLDAKLHMRARASGTQREIRRWWASSS